MDSTSVTLDAIQHVQNYAGGRRRDPTRCTRWLTPPAIQTSMEATQLADRDGLTEAPLIPHTAVLKSACSLSYFLIMYSSFNSWRPFSCYPGRCYGMSCGRSWWRRNIRRPSSGCTAGRLTSACRSSTRTQPFSGLRTVMLVVCQT